jgi:hypothetical protein
LQDLKPPGVVVSRDRVLLDDENLRRGEVGALKWDYVTPETITIPAALSKNRREHVLPNVIHENL